MRCENKISTQVYFVELKKGSDITHAYKQVTQSIQHFRTKRAPIDKDLIIGIIAARGIPKAINQEFRNLKIDFKKNWGAELKATQVLQI